MLQKLAVIESVELYPADWTNDFNEFNNHRTPQYMAEHPPDHLGDEDVFKDFTWVMTPTVDQMIRGVLQNESGLHSLETVREKDEMREYIHNNRRTLAKFQFFIVDHLDPETADVILTESY